MVGNFDINAFMTQNNQYKMIPIDLLDYNNEYERYEGEQYADMVESIKNNGILQPLIVRAVSDGRFVILSGNNRRYCGEAAGLTMFPCVIKENLSDEEAQAYIDETNIYQRGFTSLKISKQAEVVSRRYSQMFDAGKIEEIRKEIAVLSGENADAGITKMSVVGDEYGLSKNTIARLVRINSLIAELKKYVDDGSLSIRAAVELSYLPDNLQSITADMLPEFGLDMKNAALIHSLFKEDKLTENTLRSIINGTYKVVKKHSQKSLKVPAKILRRYFPTDCSEETMVDTIQTALEMYYNSLKENNNDKS